MKLRKSETMVKSGRGEVKNNRNLMDSFKEPLLDNMPGHKLFNIALEYEGNGLKEEAIKVYKDSINEGCMEAAINLGVILMYGNRVESSEASGFFLMAACKGYSAGYRNLAQMFVKQILPGGNEAAAEYYLKAANMGDARAQCNYAIMCKNGKGVKKNSSESIIWLHKSAENGYYRAQALLAEMYLNGDGVYKDVDKAVELYVKAADNGSPIAAYTLAMMFLEGKDVERNEKFGRQMLDRAVELGYSKADYEAGLIAESENDYVRAVYLYSEGANKGEPGCIRKLYDLGYFERADSVSSVSLNTDYESE